MIATVNAYAKINLFLDITGKLPNGYHEIASVMQTVDIFDYVKVAKANGLKNSAGLPAVTPIPSSI